MPTQIYSFSCTRDSNIRNSALAYQRFISSKIAAKHTWLVGSDSIFEAYQYSVDSIRKEIEKEEDNSIVIFCHDDIEIWDDPSTFRQYLGLCLSPDVGFIGAAGTTYLDTDAVWWNAQLRREGYHRGFCWQGKSRQDAYPNYFGPAGQVVVLDGLFLAISGKKLLELDLAKPEYFPGSWDFYDIYYTLQMHKKGYRNLTIPVQILHNSSGQLAGRQSWHDNREAFIEKEKLPIRCSKPA